MNDSKANKQEQEQEEAVVAAEAVAEATESEETPTDEAVENELAEEAKKVAAQEKEEEPLQLQLVRLSADFDNFRKRTRREKEIWSQQAQERLVNDLLTVVDHYELGLKNAEEHEAKTEVLDGFRMVHNQFVSVLGRYNVKAIETEGTAFNPEQHEAVSFLNSDEKAENEIIAETRKGYLMGDKLLRAAQVVVSSGPAAASPKEEG